MHIILSILTIISLSINSLPQDDQSEWTSLLDKDLSKWETYLSYSHTSLNITGPPKDSTGAVISPVGLNHDSAKVFSTFEENGDVVLRVSGRIYGCLGSLKEYGNYHLRMKVKWGKAKWPPRLHEIKDSGVLYHSRGDYGVDYWYTWKMSQEFQIAEHCFGDYWSIAGAMMDIQCRIPAGEQSFIYTGSAPLISERGNGGYCRREKDCELADGEWNTIDLFCCGDRSLHIVNGTVVMALEHSRYVQDGIEVPLTKGTIQIQSEGAEVFYKDIQIKPIAAFPDTYASYFQK
jgi:Domain of Unknown Function (DUF1080)